MATAIAERLFPSLQVVWEKVGLSAVFVEHKGVDMKDLEHQSRLLALASGGQVERGQVVGSVGDPTQNGGWFPHLHLQAMTTAPSLGSPTCR